MSELTETVYIRGADRKLAVHWLENSGLAGYALHPKEGWIQVLPDFSDITEFSEKLETFSEAPGLTIDYCFAADHVWSMLIFVDGAPIFAYECAFEVEEYTLDGIPPEELADLLSLDPDELTGLLYTGGANLSQDALRANAGKLARLLGLPNHSFASFHYVDDADEEFADLFVMPPFDEFDFAAFERVSGSDFQEPRRDVPTQKLAAVPSAPDAPPAPEKSADQAPWQALYDVANKFLELLHTEELFELTFDTRLTRDRLTERLTKAAIHTPVAGPEQLAALWLDQMMDCPEVDDVFATDDEILATLHQAMASVQ